MSNLKKIFFAVIITILVILGYSSISNAAYRLNEYKSKYGDYYIGQHKTEGYQQYLGQKALFCLEHGQRLRSQTITYTVKSIITLKGDTATGPVQDGTYKNGDIKLVEKSIADWPTEKDENGEIIKQGSNNINTKLSYVFSMLDREDKADIQEAVWWYMDSWINKIGKKFYGVNVNTAASKNEGKPDLVNEAKAYAKKAKDGPKIGSEETNIKTQVKDGYIEVGPFKWSYEGNLIGSSIKVLDEQEKEISNVTFGVYNGNNFKEIKKKDIPSNSKFYIRISLDDVVPEKITKIIGTIKVDDTTVELIFMEPDNVASWQNLMYVNVDNQPKPEDFGFDYDIPLTGKLKIKKVNEQNQEFPLPNVGFRIYNVDLGKYVVEDSSGNISYNSTGTEFKTDKNGELSIDGLLLGNYLAYETTNPNYGYEFNEEGIEITVDSQNPLAKLITNPQIYVKLSGYVYLDVQSAKQAQRNNLYRSDATMDDEDQLLSGVQVRLVDRRTRNTVVNDNGTPFIATTREIKLDDNILRYYQFVDVRIDDLSNYYIEFTYDGLTYQSVTQLREDQLYDDSMRRIGSVAAETTRDAFNREFSTIEGRTSNTGVSLNENGQETHNLSYNLQDRKATLINNGLPIGQYPITADTDATKYSIRADFTYGDEEVPYINLGIYERDQPDLRIVKDMYSAKLEINGYGHIYKYGSKLENKEEYINGNFNVGVEFGSEYGTGAYTRPIYRADAEYTNPNDPSRELKVYVTYAINIINQSTDVITRVNQVVDYFDRRYTFVSAGTGIDDGTATVTGTENVNCEPVESYSDKYSKLIINASSIAEPNQDGDTTIYVQFELGREAVVDILNDTANLDNIAEITSYSSFDRDGKVYAGVDEDSNPGNAEPTNEDTIEDDTDMSPSLKLVVADARELAGAVFEDKANSELMTGSVRQGNSRYDDSEPGIGGVDITFKENKETDGMTYRTTTVLADGLYTFNYTYQDASGNTFEHNAGEDLPAGTTVIVTPVQASESTEGAVQMSTGDFFIEDYIPGDYTLTYTWGDETYTVQNYKGTVYDKARYDQNVANKEWYKTDEITRLTDAVDDYELRQAIDAELQNITNSTQTTIDKMNSSTPTMGIGVEKDATTSSGLDKLVYRISNVDFGIIERARQDIGLTKRVTAMKVTLANGRTLVDLIVNEDGTLSGTTSNVMYLPGSTSVPQGIIRLEMDDELMGGASLEIQYTITATNNSELDYVDEDFYKFGIIPDNNEGIVTITPSGIVDYLDVDWEFEANKNPDWVSITDVNDERLDLAQTVKESEEITNRKIIYTDTLAGHDLEPIRPNNSATVQLNVSKIMTSSEDIELDNETEIVEVNKTGGGYLYNPPTTQNGPDVPATPGNYIPGTGPQVEYDDDMAERVIITSNTGANMNFILPISIVISAFVIIGVGVIFIKKKVLNK